MLEQNKPFAGKVAFVTGSSRGLGRVFAAHLASLGAAVAVHGTTPTSTRSFNEAESLAAVAEAIASATGSPVHAVHGDVTDEDVVRRIVAEVRERFSRIDLLVNNAGGDIGAAGIVGGRAGKPDPNDCLKISVADVKAVLDRNLLSCILVCREVVPEMMDRRGGAVVNISSVDGFIGQAYSGIYATAKAGVAHYTRCLAAQLRPYDVRANAIAPGSITSPRFLASRTIDEAKMVESGTLERYGGPLEVAKAVAFLLSDQASYISGQVLRTDGGSQLWPA